MTGVSRVFMGFAVVCVMIGMAWGIQMSASGDHKLSPAHAHLNLLGWVGGAIFAFYYHLVPQAATGMLARVHCVLAIAAVCVIVPGIVMAIDGTGETLAKIGSVLALASMVVFAVVVLRPARTAEKAIQAAE